MDTVALMFLIPVIIGVACIVAGAVWAFGWGGGLIVFGVMLLIGVSFFSMNI